MNADSSNTERRDVGAASSPASDVAQVDMQAAVQRVVQLYEHFTPERLDSLHSCYAAQAHFKDPFNDVYGIEAIRQIFAHMFTTVDSPQFVVTEQVVQGSQAFLVWEFRFRMRRWRTGQAQTICGGTLLRFDDQGLVFDHRDYWDAAQELYEKLPVLGALMRWLRQAGSATHAAKHLHQESSRANHHGGR